MTTLTALPTRPCSTDGCKRSPRPDWAMCDACLDDLFAPVVPPRARVRRLSETDPMFAEPAPRPGPPDLAVPVALGVSRDASRDEAVRTEAPDRRGVGSSTPVGGRRTTAPWHARPGAQADIAGPDSPRVGAGRLAAVQAAIASATPARSSPA